MRSAFAIAALVASSFAVGCAAPPSQRLAQTASDRGAPFASVQLAPPGTRPPPSCHYVARIEGRDQERRDGLTYEDAALALRRAAALAGGNYVLVETVNGADRSRDEVAFSISGRLYACSAG